MGVKETLVVFESEQVRRVWHDEQWYFSVVDVVKVLTEKKEPLKARKYWNKLSQRLRDEGSEVVTNCHQLKLRATDGKLRETDCANTESLFRIIQSIPSKKAEPFKLWLANVGYERIQEIENPELGQNRIRQYYEMKGYPSAWVDKRLRGIAIRQDLTNEWKERGVKSGKEYAILTDEISKATFGKTVKEYKEFKGLEKKNQNLRDGMNDLELIFNMLGEKVTTEITKVKNAQGFEDCSDAAVRGGGVAGNARKEAEKELGRAVSSEKNYLGTVQKKKKLEIK
jgi:DNA-damage-inducible protein D